MKKDFILLGFAIVFIIIILSAVWLMYLGKEGWGWLVFMALCMMGGF
jgi:hypothetical protein